MKSINITHFCIRAAMTLLVALLASTTVYAQYVIVIANPYEAGEVRVGKSQDLGAYLNGSTLIDDAEPGETIYFDFNAYSGYQFAGITYDGVSSDDITQLENGLYSFTMPEYEGLLMLQIFINFEKAPVIVTGININEENFPDENFRKWLLSQSYGKDAVITDAEMAGITKINARACKIQDLTGIEFFTELTELDVCNTIDTPEENRNKITSIDLSLNAKLRKLWCGYNQITSLDLSDCPDLRDLDCCNNLLTELDVTNNPLLSLLYCTDNQLTELDVKSNPNLAVLSCYSNNLTELDVTDNMLLEQLFCENNHLTTIDVTNHNKLMMFNCNNNQLTSLDLTGCTELFQLYCYNNIINGEAMTDLVNSLETPSGGGYMVVIDLDSEIEQNDITKEQADVAKANGWSVEAIENDDYVSYPKSNTHDYVDLGLTSGTLWATCNVGANTPKDVGLFFAWGDTEGHGNDVADGYLFSWENYKWGEIIGEETYFTKYCSDSSRGKDGFTDGKDELDPEDDAAYVNWGSIWRTPTKEQLDELLNECTWTPMTIGDVNGYEVTGPNDNTIFLPETGWRIDDMLLDGGAYWSRSTNPDDVGGAYYLGWDNYGWYEFGGRIDGQCIRPVINNDVIELVDNAQNSGTIETAATIDKTFDVKLSGRKLYKDGEWSTLCLPFSLSAEQLAASQLAGADIRTLATASVTGHHVDLSFGSNENSITAGTPYIIKWEADTKNPVITDPVFNGVTISNESNDFVSDDGHVNFIGNYDAFTVSPSDDPLIYYLTSGNTLTYTAKERTLKACRAYFIFTANDGNSTNNFTFNIDFGDGLNSIQNVKSNNQEEDTWFDLSGRRLNSKPTQKGIYVTKGQKVIIN